MWLNHWSPILGCQNHLRQIISIGARSDHSLEGWRVRGGRVRGSHMMKVRIRKESPGQLCMFIILVWLKIGYTVVYGPHGNVIGKMMIHQWNLRYPVLRQTHIQPMEQVWWMVSRESCWNILEPIPKIPWSTFRKAFLQWFWHPFLAGTAAYSIEICTKMWSVSPASLLLSRLFSCSVWNSRFSIPASQITSGRGKLTPAIKKKHIDKPFQTIRNHWTPI